MEKMINWDAAQFQTINVMENLQVTMPDNLQKMDDNDAQDWYLSEKRPQVIYANEERSLLCTYSIYEHPLENEQVFIAATKVKQLIQKSVPSEILSDINLSAVEGKKHGWFEALLLSGGSNRILLMYVMPLFGKFMLGTFVYPRGDYQTKQISLSIMMSLQAIGPEVET